MAIRAPVKAMGLVVVGAAIGGYLGSSQLATGASERARVVTLRDQEIAVFGGVHYIANTEAGLRHFLCQRRPRSKARFEAAVFPGGIAVYRMGNPDPIYVTPRVRRVSSRIAHAG
jgi:hypothetical protein